MEYSNFNNEIQIVLDIKDRRGKPIRVATIKDIKVKVWTENPDCFLTFNYHDIQQRSLNDVMVIPQSRMLSLPTGVITYQYSYKAFDPDCHDHHNAIRNQIVRTDLFWKNRHQNEVISNPAYYQSMEYLNDKIDHERKDRIAQYKDLQYYVTEEYTNKLNDEIERAKYKEEELESLLNAFSATTDNSIVELKSKIEEEVKRSNQVDIEMFKYIKEVEGKLETSVVDAEEKINSTKDDLTKLVAEERERATARENEIENKIEENNNKFNLKDIELNSLIEAEVSRAKTEEARIEAKVDNSIESAKDSIKKLKKQVNNISDSTDGLSSKLDQEISDRTIADNETTASLNAEIKRATTEEERIEGKIDNVNSSLDSEVSRAKLVEKDITDALQALKTLVNEVDTSLNDEIIRSQMEDDNIKRLVDILNGNEEVVGSVLHSIKDSEHRINDNIEDALTDLEDIININLSSYASKVYVDERFNHLVGTAPENLDTLEEIAERLQRDNDLFKTIQELLSGKVNKEDLQNAIQNSTNAETRLQNQLDIINGNKEVIGSIAHAVSDANHYTDDEIEKLKHLVDENEANLNNHIKEANNKFEELDDYVLKSDYTKITDGSDIIKEIQIIDEDPDDEIEIYSKAQCDAKFLKLWQGSEEDYNSLGEFDNNTIYIII